MRLLVLGGTVFLSRAVAAEAARRGHEVICAARGASGPPPDGVELVVVDRDEPHGLDALAGQRFDAAVDVATMSLPWVSRALEALAERTGHWTFVSTINVYADTETPGQDTGAALVEPITWIPAPDADEITTYGGVKVAGEQAVRAAVGERAFLVRPGLLTGPDDTKDRFGYWANRLSRGGRVAVPPPEQPIQHLDVRDLAEWLVRVAEDGVTGTYDATGPGTTVGELLDGIAEAVAPPGTELVPIPADVLEGEGITPWAGPESLPLWAPPTHHGFLARDVAASFATGLRTRPVAETARAALDTERELGLDRPRQAGLSSAAEARLLDRLR